MMHRLRPYWSSFRLRALLETQYRGAALGGLVTNSFFGLVLVLLYTALFEDSDPVFLRETITYVWLQQGFFRALYTSDGTLPQLIMTGGIAYSLVRPVDQQLWWASRDLATRVVGSLMRLIPMLVVQLLLPAGLRLALPGSPAAFLQFAVSISLGYVCLTAIGSICSAFIMLTMDSRGISAMLNLLMAILCGNIIPLTLFPDRLQALIRYQPFAQALDAPIRMYLHAQSAPDFLLNLGVQLVWVAALQFIARTLWQSYMRRLVVQGG